MFDVDRDIYEYYEMQSYVCRYPGEMLAAEGEECELQQLVPPDDDSRLMSKSGEVTPPVTAGVSKVTQTSPTSPDSNKVSNRVTMFTLVKIFACGHRVLPIECLFEGLF
jgi:hypothetical protein